MAQMVAGKRKGEQVKIHQFANDWIMLEDGTIVKPTLIQLDADEIETVRKHERLWPSRLFVWFDLGEDGRFTPTSSYGR